MRTNANRKQPRVGIVGPCTSGKSTLIRNLRAVQGVEWRHIAQEHSYVPTMWQKISNPDWLIFLDVSFPISQQRKQLNWTQDEYMEQQRRLAHAKEHADFYLNTDGLSPTQVAQAVIDFLKSKTENLSDEAPSPDPQS